MYTVIGSLTTRAFRVVWMLEELGVEYTNLNVKPRSEAVLKYNPSGKVPVLLDGDAPICDSTAILTYLGDKHGGLCFPTGTIERAQQDAFLHQILDEIDAVLWTAARHSFVLPEAHRVPEVKPSLKWEFERNLNRLMDQMKGPFLMGDTFTVPDIILTNCANWAQGARFPCDHEKFKTYVAEVRARPAFQRVLALS